MSRPPTTRPHGPPVRRAATSALIALLTLWSCSEADPTNPNPTPSNTAPVAQAGPDLTVSTTLAVRLDGSGSSDADGDGITWTWSITSAPAGSAAALDDAASTTPSFTPDVPGTYVVRLVVTDGTDDSTPDDVSIVAEDNTASATIDPAGGDVTSSDAVLAMAIPAAALAAEEEITITHISTAQMPAEFAEVGPDALAFDLRPDGLQFAAPVAVEVVPADLQPTQDGDEYTVPLLASVTLSDGTLELASDQELTGDFDAMTSTLRGTIEHFSEFVAIPIFRLEGPTFSMGASLLAPSVATVGEPFEVTVGVGNLEGISLGPIDVSAGDDSEAPVQAVSDFEDPLPLLEGLGFSGRKGTEEYVCTAPGAGTLAIDVEISGLVMPVPGELRIAAEKPLRVRLSKSVNCIQELQAFGPFDLPSPEGFAPIETAGPPEVPGPMVYAHTGGARLADGNGDAMADFSAAALSGVAVFGAAGNPDDGVMVTSPQGLFAFSGMLPTEASETPPMLTLEALQNPTVGPDLTAQATDVIAFGGVGARGMAAVLFEDQDIAFFSSGTDAGGGAGFTFRDDLAEAFKPGGISVFGVDFPVSVWVGPNGFDADNPMLAVTVSNDAAEMSKLWRVGLVGDVAVATEVDDIFPYAGARQVRCTENICAIAAYGTGVGFGGVSRFTWDGGDGFAPIAGIGGGRAIGIDVRLIEVEPRRFRISQAAFLNNTYTVFDVSATGEYLNHVTSPLPEDCEGAGHVRLRVGNQLLISCNQSGRITVVDVLLPG